MLMSLMFLIAAGGGCWSFDSLLGRSAADKEQKL